MYFTRIGYVTPKQFPKQKIEVHKPVKITHITSSSIRSISFNQNGIRWYHQLNETSKNKFPKEQFRKSNEPWTVDTFHTTRIKIESNTPATYVSPYQLKTPPLDAVILFNPSPHANNFAIQQLKKAWPSLRIIQVCQTGRTPNKEADQVIFIPKEKWKDPNAVKARFNELALHHPELKTALKNGKIGLYPIWSPQAEDPDVAQKVIQNGFVWIGASPETMDGLDKINYKQLCQKHAIPTAPFFVLDAPAETPETGNRDQLIHDMTRQFFHLYRTSGLGEGDVFIKSIYGGGGRGTARVSNLSEENIKQAIAKVVSETGSATGIYVEQGLNLKDATMYQIEIELDNGQVAPGGRLVWFNDRNQKVIEIGLTDDEITRLIPADVYRAMRQESEIIGRESGYNNRGTNEILIVKDKNGRWSHYHSEFNKRIQVENRALADLVTDKHGHVRNIPAEQVMRSCGYPAPTETDGISSGANIIAHVRLIVATPREGGWIFPNGVDIHDVISPTGGYDLLINRGPIYSDTDPQVGSCIIKADNWEDFCDKLQHFSANLVLTGANTWDTSYLEFLQKLSLNPRFKKGELGCNETTSVLQDPPVVRGPFATVTSYLSGSVTNLIINGYRKGEGVPNQPYPTSLQIETYLKMQEELDKLPTPETPFSELIRSGDLETYFTSVREQLAKHGGGTVTVWPRDVQQESGDQESASIQQISASITSKTGILSGVIIGLETGGAQYQSGLMRGFDWWNALLYGCSPNLPSFSLSRSEWLNGLERKTPSQLGFALSSISGAVKHHYGILPDAPLTPWFPYNFHAGNHPRQDIVTGLMLDAGMSPVPTWAWDPRYTREHFKGWIHRQLDLFEEKGRIPHQIRIKNPGQRKEWTAEEVYTHVRIIRHEYKQRHLPDPIIFIHNHNFDGKASHVGAELFVLAQKDRYDFLVIDTAPHGMTHNSNLITLNPLRMTKDEKDALMMYNHYSHIVADLTVRFNNQKSVSRWMPPTTIWAGGTASSDLASALKMNIKPEDIEPAKRLAAEVFGLGTIVTPYSEWMKWVGFAIWQNKEITPKTAEAVERYVLDGGRLNIPNNVLEGLQRWETLLPRPQIVETLLKNHGMAATPPLNETAQTREEPFDPEALRRELQQQYPNLLITNMEVATVVAFDKIGREFLSLKEKKQDLTPLMDSPEFIHTAEHKAGTRFLVNDIPVELTGKTVNPATAKVTLQFRVNGIVITTEGIDLELEKKLSASGSPKKAKADSNNPKHIGAKMPGSVTEVLVKPGEVIKEKGQPLYEIESMKMKFIERASETHVGKTIEEVAISAGQPVDLNDLLIRLS